MKQPKVPEAPSLPSAPRGPRYRYFSNPPSNLKIRLGDFGDIPPSAFTPFFDAERQIEVPASEILQGPVPKISLSRLAALVPDAFQVGIHGAVQLKVPISRLAVSYRLVEERELIEEPPEEIPIIPPVEETFAALDIPSPAEEKFAPTVADLMASESIEKAVEEKKPAPKLPPIAPPAPTLEARDKLVPEPKEPLAKAVPVSLAPSNETELSKIIPPVVAEPPTPPLKPAPEASLEKKVELPVPQNANPPVPPVLPPIAATALVPSVKPAPVVPPEKKENLSAPQNVNLPPPPAVPPTPPSTVSAPLEEPVPAPPSPAQVAPPAPVVRKPFSLLPIFRRKVVETPKPIVPEVPAEPRARVEIPKPKKTTPPLTALSPEPSLPSVGPIIPPPPGSASPPPKPSAPDIPALAILKEETPAPKSEPEAKIAPSAKVPEPISVPPPVVLKEEVPESKAEPEAKIVPPLPKIEPLPVPPPAIPKADAPVADRPVVEPTPAPSLPALPKTEAVFLETEHLPEEGKGIPAEIPEQDSLQALFLTEDLLSVERVVELCNGLPGIKSCILTRSGAVVNARNVPDSIDLISLSANALEMFGALRGSCAKMGIGAVPAVTMHSEKGPITFFHEEDICLLVLHKDRGFVPGVREKLQMVVEELAKANLPLPISGRAPKELK